MPGLGQCVRLTAGVWQPNQEYERALALAPGNSEVQGRYGGFAIDIGRTEAGITAARRTRQTTAIVVGTSIAAGFAIYIGIRKSAFR